MELDVETNLFVLPLQRSGALSSFCITNYKTESLDDLKTQREIISSSLIYTNRFIIPFFPYSLEYHLHHLHILYTMLLHSFNPLSDFIH